MSAESSATLEFALGRMQVRLGETQAGLANMQAAGRKQPGYREAWRTAGLLLAMEEQHQEAIDMFSNMLSIDPRDAHALGLIASSRSHLGEHTAAEDAYRAALEIAPNSADYRLGLVQSLHAQQRFLAAAKNIQVLIDTNPDDPDLRLLQAQCLLASEEWRSAEQGMNVLRSMDHQPEDWAQTCFTLAWAYRNHSNDESETQLAAKWMQIAAEAKLPAAQAEFACMLLEGRGRQINAREGAQWMRHAAESGLASAQINLARLYLRGQGVSKSHAQARHWLQLSAAQGHPEAHQVLNMWDASDLGEHDGPNQASSGDDS